MRRTYYIHFIQKALSVFKGTSETLNRVHCEVDPIGAVVNPIFKGPPSCNYLATLVEYYEREIMVVRNTSKVNIARLIPLIAVGTVSLWTHYLPRGTLYLETQSTL